MEIKDRNSLDDSNSTNESKHNNLNSNQSGGNGGNNSQWSYYIATVMLILAVLSMISLARLYSTPNKLTNAKQNIQTTFDTITIKEVESEILLKPTNLIQIYDQNGNVTYDVTFISSGLNNNRPNISFKCSLPYEVAPNGLNEDTLYKATITYSYVYEAYYQEYNLKKAAEKANNTTGDEDSSNQNEETIGIDTAIEELVISKNVMEARELSGIDFIYSTYGEYEIKTAKEIEETFIERLQTKPEPGTDTSNQNKNTAKIKKNTANKEHKHSK